MTSNTRFWDALKTTDPKYTKAVTFGQKFTSINAQWQIQRMTEQFGPVGKGWGYNVAHSIERIRDDYVLAIADVEIWWCEEEGIAGQFGPVRGMCPIVEKGKSGIREDDDAGKKAMTDALTKGLSHIGLSADVFLGLYDDNKYVRKLQEQFKGETIAMPTPQPSSANGRRMAADEPHLATDRPKGTVPQANAKKTAVEKAKEWTDKAIQTLNLGDHTVDSLSRFWSDNTDKIEWLEQNAADQHERFITAYDNAAEAARAKVTA